VIVTVTLDPALLVGYTAARVRLGSVNRVRQVSYRAGGTGLTVARILHTFGHEVVAAGLAGGAAGELIRGELSRSGIPTGFTPIALESRRVLTVTGADDGLVTSFDEPAPYITTEELGRLARDYRGLLDGATAVVLCGGLAAGLPPEIYASMTTYAAEAGVPAIVAAAGEPLWLALPRHPALVIPDPPAGRGSEGRAGLAGGTHGGTWPGGGAGLEGGTHGGGGSDGGAGLAAGTRGGGPDGGAALAGGIHGGGAGPGDGAGLGGAGLGSAGLDGASLDGTAGLGSAPGLLLKRGARAAVVTAPGPAVSVATPDGQWRARLPGAAGWPVHDALVAGFVPGVALGWSWADTLRHAVALAVTADPGGAVDLGRYEQLLAEVAVESAGAGPAVPA
jgi:tagatose 6-phosphate kinase